MGVVRISVGSEPSRRSVSNPDDGASHIVSRLLSSMGPQCGLDDTAADLDRAPVVRRFEFDLRNRAVDRSGRIRHPDAWLRKSVRRENDGPDLLQAAKSDDRILFDQLAPGFLVTEKWSEFPVGISPAEFDGFSTTDREDMAISHGQVEEKVIGGSEQGQYECGGCGRELVAAGDFENGTVGTK